MKVADEAWVSLALLHLEHPGQSDFAVKEIKERARKEGWILRQGFYQHISSHCVANKPPDPVNHRMLYENSRGRKRLFRQGDPCHPDRKDGKVHPDRKDLPTEYQNLLDWYEADFLGRARESSGSNPAPAVSHVGFGSALRSNTLPPNPDTAFVSSAGAFVIPEDLRRALGISEGTRLNIQKEGDHLILQPVTAELIDRVAGSYKGKNSMVEARERDHRIER